MAGNKTLYDFSDFKTLKELFKKFIMEIWQ